MTLIVTINTTGQNILFTSMSDYETQRIQQLHEHYLLDTPAEQVFDDIVLLAAQICGTPFALVTLVDTDRVWFKAKTGITVSENKREGSFCAETILHQDVIVVSNALNDKRFSTNPLVTAEPNLRFYCGAPIRTQTGHALGTLCVLDSVPRALSADQIEALRALTRQVVFQFEYRRKKMAVTKRLKKARHNQLILQNTLDMQSALLSSANVSIIATDLQGTITIFNRAAQLMLGYSETEVVGKCTPAIFHEPFEIGVRSAQLSEELGTSIEPGFETFVAKARAGEPDEQEWTAIRKDGSRFMTKLSVTCLHGAENNITGYLGIGIDISRRKETEIRLKNSEKFTRFTLDALSKQFCVLDENGILLAINKPWLDFERERGSDLEALRIGQNYLEILDTGHADSRGENAYAEKIRSVMTGSNQGLSIEYAYKIKSEHQWFVGKIIPFPDRKLGSVILSHENITEHKFLQHRFEQAIETAPNAIVLVNELGLILMVNLQTEASFGYSRQELIGQPMEILMPERFRGRHAYFRNAYFANPKSRPMGPGYDLFGLRKDGTEFPIEIGLGLIDDQKGNIILSSIIDITDRKDADNKLKDTLIEKEVLLKEVYHRVKNNLQVVSSLINLQAKNVINEEAKDLLKQSADRIKSMALLHEKLYQSKDLAKIDFNEYIRSLVEHLLFGYGAQANKITVNILIDKVFLDVDTAIPCGLIANELITNILKHAFPDQRPGNIDITFKRIENTFIFVISDNGIGFPIGLDFRINKSLGLQLVNTLSNQLMANIAFDQTSGSSFTLQFSSQL